jgi:hypothetical protein
MQQTLVRCSELNAWVLFFYPELENLPKFLTLP